MARISICLSGREKRDGSVIKTGGREGGEGDSFLVGVRGKEGSITMFGHEKEGSGRGDMKKRGGNPPHPP